MGKQKRARQKFHIRSKKCEDISTTMDVSDTAFEVPAGMSLSMPKENLFSGLNIDIASLKTSLQNEDDVRSVKSSKSTKSDKTKESILLPKKEKLKMRREMLLKKIEAVKQMKKEVKIREKRKHTAIMGDTNPLHDALPSLESLLKSRPNIKQNVVVRKPKGVEKANRRKRELVQGVKIFKSVLGNKTFQKNPLEAISQHVQAVVAQERSILKSDE